MSNGWDGNERRESHCDPDDFVRKETYERDRARIETDIVDIKKDLKDSKAKCDNLDNKFLTKELFFSHFKPIRMYVFGMIGLILAAVLKWFLAFIGLVR